MSEQHTPGRLVEDTRGPRADIRSESGRIVAVTYGLGFPKTAEGLEKRTKEDRANRRRLAACWNACEGIDTEYLEGDDSLPHYARRLMAQRDELLAALEKIAGFTLSQFMGPHDMALECVTVACAAIAKAKGGAA